MTRDGHGLSGPVWVAAITDANGRNAWAAAIADREGGRSTGSSRMKYTAMAHGKTQ